MKPRTPIPAALLRTTTTRSRATFLGLNHYQIEMLANLDKVPEAGAIVLVTFPKPEEGTGFPARVVADRAREALTGRAVLRPTV